MRNIASLVLFLYVFCCNFNVLACETSWIFRTAHEKDDRACELTVDIGVPGGAFAIFEKARTRGKQEYFDGTLEILNSDLDDELPFFIARSIAREESFADPAMKERFLKLEPVRRAIDIVRQKQQEREKIEEIFLENFPWTEKEHDADPYYLNKRFVMEGSSSLKKRIQSAQHSCLRHGIVFPELRYFVKNTTSDRPEFMVNETLSEFWRNPKLHKLEIKDNLHFRRYSLLECLLFEKEMPSADRLSQLRDSRQHSYFVLERLFPRILEEAKKGDEFCMEALCFMIKAYHERRTEFISYGSFEVFAENVEKDVPLMKSLVSYLKKNTMLNLQSLIDLSWKYKEIAVLADTIAEQSPEEQKAVCDTRIEQRDCSVLESLFPRILDEAKKGDELSIEALCYLLQGYQTPSLDLVPHEQLVKFVQCIKEDKTLTETLFSYFKKATTICFQRLIERAKNYEETHREQLLESDRPTKKQKRDDTVSSETTPEGN